MNATTQDHINSAIDNLNYEGYTVQAEAVEALRNRATQLAEDVVTLMRTVNQLNKDLSAAQAAIKKDEQLLSKYLQALVRQELELSTLRIVKGKL